MSYKNISRLLSLLIVLWFIWYLSWPLGIIPVGIFFCAYGILFFPIYVSYKKIKQKNYEIWNKKNIFKYFVQVWSRLVSGFALFLILLWSFAYYQNEISPAFMPRYTLTNGEKTIVFQTMSHIWSHHFYQEVQSAITKYKEDGYAYFYEWVRGGTEENQENFNQALWLQLDSSTYASLSKLYWLENQDNRLFLGLVNNDDYNVDVSIDDIMSQYDEIPNKTENKILRLQSTPLDANQLVNEQINSLSPRELLLLQYVNRSFINFIVKSNFLQTTIQENFSNKDLFDIILHKRNEVIADKIINFEGNKIFLTYGMLHFEGIYEILKRNDIKWHITQIDYLPSLK